MIAFHGKKGVHIVGYDRQGRGDLNKKVLRWRCFRRCRKVINDSDFVFVVVASYLCPV